MSTVEGRLQTTETVINPITFVSNMPEAELLKLARSQRVLSRKQIVINYDDPKRPVFYKKIIELRRAVLDQLRYDEVFQRRIFDLAFAAVNKTKKT